MARVGTEVGMPVSFDVGWNLGTFPPWLGGGYDSDALAYFTAFETAGGSFDLTDAITVFTDGDSPSTLSPAPTITKGVANAAATLGGTVVSKDDSGIRYIGGSVAVSGDTSPINQCNSVFNQTFTDGSRTGAISSVEFQLDCTEFEFRVHGDGMDFRLRVDGDVDTVDTSLPADGSLTWYKVTFASKASRRIRIDSCTTQLRFAGLTLDATGTIGSLPALSGKKIVFLGDSFIEGTGSVDDHKSLAAIAAQRLGSEDYTISGFGGTGYITEFYPGYGSTRDDIEGRFQSDALDANPDYVVIAAGINDTYGDGTAFRTAVSNVLNAADLAGVPVILVAPWNPSAPTPRTGDQASKASDLELLAGEHLNAFFLDPDTVSYTKSDSTHPDDAGHITLGEWLAGAIATNVFNNTYTESYLKTSIDNFVVGCKTDGVWDKMTEAYLMAGGTFAGLMTKLKYLDIGETDLITPTLLNGGFETAGGGGADVFADWSESASGSSTVNRDTVEFDTGVASLRLDIDASNSGASCGQQVLTVGASYQYSIRAKCSTDGKSFAIVYGSSQESISISTEWATYTGTFISNGTVFTVKRNSASSSSIWIDSITLTKVPTKSLTNNNFVTGDYLGVGTGAGLTGDGSTKYLDTGLLDSSLSADDKSFGAYITSLPTITPSTMMGSRANTPSQLGSSFVFTGVGTQTTYAPQPDCTINITEASAFHATVSRRGVNDVEAYANGSSVGTDTSTASATGLAQEWFLFARNFNGSPNSHSDPTLTFAHIGTGLTDTDASNLSLRVNKLMYDLGCNTY